MKHYSFSRRERERERERECVSQNKRLLVTDCVRTEAKKDEIIYSNILKVWQL